MELVQSIKDPIAELIGSWTREINIYSIIIRILLSVLIGAIIGCERAQKRHAAGLRTFILITLASTMAMLLDSFVIPSGTPVLSAAVIIGVAIISSNSVLYSSKNQIKGLTTSAGMWTCAVIGLLLGAGFYTVALIGFVAFICCLFVFPKFERYLKNKSNHFEVHLELKNKDNLQNFVATIRQLGMRIDDIELNPAYINSGLSVYSVLLTIESKELKKYKTHKEIIEAIRSIDYINHIEEIN